MPFCILVLFQAFDFARQTKCHATTSGTVSVVCLEFKSCPKRDHADRGISANPASQKSGRRAHRRANGPEPCQRSQFTRYACGRVPFWCKTDGVTEIRMVKDIVKLHIEAQRESFFNRKALHDIEIGPGKAGSPDRVATQVPVLTIRRTIRGETSVHAWIDDRLKCVGIEPLNCSGDRYTRDRRLVVKALTGYGVCENSGKSVDESSGRARTEN